MLGRFVACISTWRAAHDQHCRCVDTNSRIARGALRCLHYRPHFIHQSIIFVRCLSAVFTGHPMGECASGSNSALPSHAIANVRFTDVERPVNRNRRCPLRVNKRPLPTPLGFRAECPQSGGAIRQQAATSRHSSTPGKSHESRRLSDRNLAVPFASALDGIQFGDSQFALDSPASSARCAVDR